MLYHDFHLSDYVVSEFGKRITLHLVYDYPPKPRLDSVIEFANVAAYHFVHTGGSIIIDIRERILPDLLDDIGAELRERFRLFGGYLHWNDDPQVYLKSLESEGYRSWEIDSAIGFAGYVIAKQISQLMPNHSPDPTLSSGTSRAGHEPRLP
jgi:hypothetical protein